MYKNLDFSKSARTGSYSCIQIVVNLTSGSLEKKYFYWWVWPFILNYSHFHTSYREYSRVQTLKAHKSYKIVLSYAHVIVFYCAF